MSNLIGRREEIKLLHNALKSNYSELIAVYGRRRVGKTFLIREVYKKEIVFSFSGLFQANLKTQLQNFHFLLSKNIKKTTKPKSWLEAFYQLEAFLDKKKSKKKKVIFIDEFPWLDSRKSNFLTAFDNFWNNYASKRNDLVVVICGSAASYMIKHILKNTGGLHNRITNKIHLKPFNLYETALLLKANRVKLSKYDILQLYMCMGGIPHYLQRVLPGESVVTIIDRLCFEKDGFLRSEFEAIFFSLFIKAENHIAIVKVLAKVRKGLTRAEILKKTKLKSGGTFSKTLNELTESGFIHYYLPYKGTKDSLYRLTDEYSMFYLKFIQTNISGKGTWQTMYNQNSYKIWSGFSFETICMKHIKQIKQSLGISGILATTGSWIEKNKKQGAQIDLLIDRNDNAINLCEIKFYNSAFTITKSYAENLRKKKQIFLEKTKTTKSIFITFITIFGLHINQYSLENVQNEVVMLDLFNE